MQRLLPFLAYFFICTKGFAQQYPFVHYTPKDGLISNQIKNIYQDSKGRLFFPSVNGLSVYDGSRFTNYTSKNGLNFDIVNCVMEMGDDSVWIITNSSNINCLVNGKMKTVDLKGNPIPVINLLVKDSNQILYAGTDQGLFYLDKDRFIKLPFADTSNKDLNTFIISIIPVGDYLLIQRDYATLLEERRPLYLYNKVTKKITAEIENIYSVNKSPDGRIWASTEKNILSIDTLELKKGKIVLTELPGKFSELKNIGGYFILFDGEGNGWLGDQNHSLLKAAPDGTITYFTASSGLSMFYINMIFRDREGITWIATNNAGINKLVQSNFSLEETPYKISLLYDISYNESQNELLLYSTKKATAAIISDHHQIYYHVEKANRISQLIKTPHGIFGTWINNVYKMTLKGNTLYPETILSDLPDNVYSGYLIDKNGNLIVSGKYHLSAIVNGKVICIRKLNFYSDHVAMDSKGNIWTANRAGELIMYQPHPDDPANYLEQKKIFSKELSGFSPRSIIIDKKDNIWIGTRSHGIVVFSRESEILTKKFHITTASGLSDDFIYDLACDGNNNIWTSSALGLDMISIKNGVPVIENLTKQNNIYQSVFKTIIDKDNTARALVSNGLIKITAKNKKPGNYIPTLMVSMVKAGKDTISSLKAASLSHKQNNLSFNFAATSFLDEKQVLYSYRLQGGTNDQWSEPSNNATVSFINLPSGNYTLHIKANFPAGHYPEQIIHYRFSISPPWWQTWWLRSITGLLLIGILILTFRFYYRRKLEKQKTILEKQQAIEKERTRIATDMHDDLGAGLSRIKFLSQSLGNKDTNDESIKTALEKITSYSDEMAEKMGEIVWALNEKNDTLADLVAYTRSYAVEYLATHDIECKANTPLHLPGTFIPGEIRRNIFLSVKECLHNIVKHAGATRVSFSVELNGKIQIVIHDNGKGIDWNDQRPYSNGLENIRKRMAEISGKVDFINEQGTKVLLNVPLNL
jgi:signal transduction histidine kinase/ligand-binding sensor domain-containing protein